MNISLYKEKIKKYDVISFDMYDTLVWRNVGKPSDIFFVVEHVYNKRMTEGEKKISGFFQNRIQAYENAYKNFKAYCSIDDIYREMTSYDDKQKEVLKAIEIEIESSICVVNTEVLELFSYARKLGKQVVIISDMYFHKDVISNILKTCEIVDYDKLYVSCDYGKSKTDGKLYDVCCKELGVKPRQVLHFGDGFKNDFLRALQKGICTVRVKRKIKFDYNDSHGLNEAEEFVYRTQQSFIANHIELVNDEIGKLGFSVFAPLVIGFCMWLHNEIQCNHIEKVFFLAREGLIFKTVYEILYPSDTVIRKYLYVSRKSLVAPTYWIEDKYENVIKSVAKTREIEVSTLLKRWGIVPEQYIKVVTEVGLSLQTVLDGQHLTENRKVKKLYERLKDNILKQSKLKYELLKEYLLQEELGGRCAIVDIGWNGGMQNAFEKIASIWSVPTEIYGYYIGINTSNLGVKLHNLNGFVYDEKSHPDNRYLIYSFAGPLELSLTAAHDTTIGYQKENNMIKPILGSNEYINEDGSLRQELEYTIKLQKGIMQYANLWRKEYLGEYVDVKSEAAFRNCRLFGVSPALEHIALFDGFTANDLGVKQHFVDCKYKGLLGKKNIINGFWTSTWKSGYLKRVFKLPLPYYKVYIYMRKKIN